MSQYDPPGTPHLPGPPHPDPDRLLARRSVRWTIISVVVSTVLALAGLFFQAAQAGGGSGGTSGGGSGGSSGGTDSIGTSSGASGNGGTGGGGSATGGTAGGGTDNSGTDNSGTDSGDGLTSAERTLRDSLNSEQWQRNSCEHITTPEATAALRCTVSTVVGTAKATITTYPSKSKADEVYQTYTSQLPEQDCSPQGSARTVWREDDSSTATGDMACYWASAQYVIFCTYYDRPALFAVTGTNSTGLMTWWRSLQPVFTD
ncbi:hypothetical protein ABZT17_18410 [Streptomyces sp. NPDC005648]|uniref:hypothetical protein n=1 Tax=Streptomyces sp. NPDC005648 TaxID=3157044 RepID=UPI0033BB5363